MNILINGVNYSWADISFVLFGRIIKGITEISYQKNSKKENNYGQGSEPISRGYGNNEYTASFTIYRDEWLGVIALAPSLDPTLIPLFDIPIVFGSSRVSSQTDVLRGCEFIEDSFKASQGEQKLLIQIPLIIAGISHL